MIADSGGLPTGKHANCRRCYDLAQEAWNTAMSHKVNSWTAVDGDHAGMWVGISFPIRHNNPITEGT